MIKYFLIGIVLLATNLAAKDSVDKELFKETVQKEIESLLRPKFNVKLTPDTNSISPVLGIVGAGYLYFSQSYPLKPCIGENVYRVSLDPGLTDKERVVERIVETSCVIRLSFDGRRVIVRKIGEKNNVKIGTPSNGKLVSVFSGTENTKARINHTIARINQIEGQEYYNSNRYLWSYQNNLFRLLIGSKESNEFGLMSIPMYSKESKVQVRPVVFPEKQKLLTTQSQLVWDDFDNTYISLLPVEKSSRLLPRIYIVDSSSNEMDGELVGNDFSYTEAENWSSLPFRGNNSWAIRSPKFMTAAKAGLLVYDDTSRDLEWKSVSYLSNGLDEVVRILLPNSYVNGLKGLQYYSEGLVISLPKLNQVVWVGMKSPFDGKVFKPEPFYSGLISDDELAKIQELIKE